MDAFVDFHQSLACITPRIVFRRSTYCILIVLYLQDSYALYLDSRSADKRKDYPLIKGVLDDALNGFIEKASPIKKEVVRRGQLIFKHNTTFPVLKQPTNSSRDGYYAIHHMGVLTGLASASVSE
jgi:hypothetical protein